MLVERIFRNGKYIEESLLGDAVRIYTEPTKRRFIDVREHDGGIIVTTGTDSLLLKPNAANTVVIKGER